MVHAPFAADTGATSCVRKVDPADIRLALAKRLDDFLAASRHAMAIGIIYPIGHAALDHGRAANAAE